MMPNQLRDTDDSHGELVASADPSTVVSKTTATAFPKPTVTTSNQSQPRQQTSHSKFSDVGSTHSDREREYSHAAEYETQTTAVSSPANSCNAPTPQPTKRLSRIGPYKLGRTLGVGSTGRVKLGTHVGTGEKVAIKILPRSKGSATDQRKLEREITIMKLVKHPNVLRLYDVYETEKELFLILELVQGGELFDYLVRMGRLAEPEARKFFHQIIAGLEFCHKHRICHRDLKPENLLLDNQMNIKIADFGMASCQRSGSMLKTSCGSPHYASPEIIKGVHYDGPCADIWSCGVILYALVSGNLPFDDDNIRRLLNKVKAGAFQMPRDVSPNVKDLLSRMMTVDPEHRITLQGIIDHHWFRMKPYEQIRFEGQLIMNQSLTEDNIDAEIFQSLVLLGWEDEENLKGTLMSSDASTEKVFYYLLSKRKHERPYGDSEDTLDNVDPSTPKRRQESFVSLTGLSTTDMSVSPTFRMNPSAATSATHLHSPTYRPSLLSRESQVNKSTPELRKKPKNLMINIPKRAMNEIAPVTGASSGSKTGLDSSKLSSSSAGTPLYTTTPKRSWLASIFHFKPEIISFECTKSTSEVLNYVRCELLKAGGKITDSRRTGFKCRINEDSLKLRVEISESAQSHIPKVVRFMLSQGSSSTFQQICTRIKIQWLSAHPDSQSPASTYSTPTMA